MDFINEPVEIERLPQAEDVPLKPIEKDYLEIIRIEWAISSTILLIIAALLIVFIPSLRDIVWIVSIFAGWLLLTITYFFFQTKAFHIKGYALRDKDLVYREGYFVQRVSVCPFNRIQHSSVSTSFLERKYGLATIIFYTAGTDDADLRIPGLKAEDANAVKEWVTQKIIHEELPAT